MQVEPQDFSDVQVGDVVTRILGGLPMKLEVHEVRDGLIVCHCTGPDDAWTFDRKTGLEVDDRFTDIVSYLTKSGDPR